MFSSSYAKIVQLNGVQVVFIWVFSSWTSLMMILSNHFLDTVCPGMRIFSQIAVVHVVLLKYLHCSYDPTVYILAFKWFRQFLIADTFLLSDSEITVIHEEGKDRFYNIFSLEYLCRNLIFKVTFINLIIFKISRSFFNK